MEALFRLLPGPQPIAVRYGATLMIVLAGFVLRYAMGDGTGRYGFIHFILPVVAASLLFDRGTGFFAVALSAGLVSYLVPWGDNTTANLKAIAVFATVGCCLVFVAEGLNKALAKAHVAQRTTELLLEEMSHRVKNKFAMISSIIALQARNAGPEVTIALEDVASRVKVIATVHNYLQRSRHDGLIEMAEYLPGLCNALREALCAGRPILLTAKSVQAQLPAEKALAAGLIVNELVTNAIKYAFPPETPGRVDVELARTNGHMVLSIRDDGRGFSSDQKAGLGTRLVTTFAAQMGGTAQWEHAYGPGCLVSVTFPEKA
jgi:two-component system, sensor histidine kinase PdtaS